MLHKIIRRAGFEPWPRAWNNLRASRATELAEEFPGPVAAAWLGHTEEIADAHYRQVLPDHFAKAVKKAAHIPAHNPAEMVEIEGKLVVRPLRENEKAPEFPGLSVPCRDVQGRSGGGGGNRNGADFPRESADVLEGDAESDAVCVVSDSRLVRLIEVWPALGDDVKSEILRLAGYDDVTTDAASGGNGVS